VQHVTLRRTPVDFDLVGEGEPVVLVHARPFTSWYLPLVEALDGWAVVRYERPAPDDHSFGIADDAELCARLVSYLGLERPHVVGHSYGGIVALEIARQGRMDIRSLALLEPAGAGLAPPAEAAANLGPLRELAAAQGSAAAMDAFVGLVCGAGGLDLLDRLVPGAVADARANADGFLRTEMPAAIAWSFTEDDARAIGVPVLNLRGGDTDPRFVRSAEIIRSWFPGAHESVVPGLNHLLTAQGPDAVAERLVEFWRSTSA
jgi:pimeloyl-ACP methyl ester carboxylesterase